MKALFLVNPRSGARRRYDVASLIRDSCKLLPMPYELERCDSKEELDGIVAEAGSRGVDVIFAVGGDGTVHEVAKRLIGTRIALSVVPIGSGNGFARHVGIPISPRKALAECSDGKFITIDTATVNDLPFVTVLGIGLDAEIAHRFAASSARGLKTYLREGIRAFNSSHAAEYEIDVDGEKVTRRAAVIAIANASQYGNNARIAPVASLQDGLLDAVAVDPVGFWSALPMMVRLFNGTLDRSAHVSFRQGTVIRVRRPDAGPAHVDGEPIMLPAELVVRIRPRSLKLLVPKAVGRV